MAPQAGGPTVVFRGRAPARQVRNWAIHPATEFLSEHGDIIRDPATGRVKQWVKDCFDRQTGNFLFTPAVPDPKTVAGNLDPETTLATLVPYGRSTLRITCFPQCEATRWRPAACRAASRDWIAIGLRRGFSRQAARLAGLAVTGRNEDTLWKGSW